MRLEFENEQQPSLDIRYHFLKENILDGKTELILFISTKEIAGVFMKPSYENDFNQFLHMLGMMNPNPALLM